VTRLPPGRREIQPSRRERRRPAPSLGRSTGVSVPISFGLPLIAVGLALIVAGINSDRAFFWMAGAVVLAGGLGLFATGKRL
jgi:fucose permease